MSRSTTIVAIVGIIILFLGVAISGYIFSRNESASLINNNESSTSISQEASSPSSTPTSSKKTKGKINLFGIMLPFESSMGFMGNHDAETLAEQSWLTVKNSDSYNTLITRMNQNFKRNVTLAAQTSFSSGRDLVAPFTWNVIQSTQDSAYDWTLPDQTMTAAGKAGITISAVIQPFASWDTQERMNATYCKGIDFVFSDHATGNPVNTTAYTAWVKAMVDRYNGDGVNDMPGLATKVSSWEIGNEVEGQCSGSLVNADTYIALLKTTRDVIKAEDSQALVLNAGALEVYDQNGSEIAQTANFWKNFFAQGGADNIDIFNIHYNRERAGILPSLTNWEKSLTFFRNLLDNNSHTSTPLWLTEYGTYSGTPHARPSPNGMTPPSQPTQTEEEQQAWYFRTVVSGLPYNVSRYFVDLAGADNDDIGGSAMFSMMTQQPRLFLKTITMLGTKITDMKTTEKIADGQYRITKNDGSVLYALWNGTPPKELFGKTVTIDDMDGNETSSPATDISFSLSSPILITSSL